MISMTGFGRFDEQFENRRIAVEIKSVNGRYLDVNIRLPRQLQFLDPLLRKRLQSYVSRGKVDIWITMESDSDTADGLLCNEALAAAYVDHMKKMSAEFDIPLNLSAVSLAKMPEIFTLSPPRADEDELKKDVFFVFDRACDALVSQRCDEGERLLADLKEKVAELSDCLKIVKERSPLLLKEYEERLYEKVRETAQTVPVDESRIASELVIFSDKVSNDEELVRLESHLQEMEHIFAQREPVGRKLDFMVQELNREVNTMMSKANDIAITKQGVLMKTCIEKIREQIQNIE